MENNPQIQNIPETQQVITDIGSIGYDYLIHQQFLCTGKHSEKHFVNEIGNRCHLHQELLFMQFGKSTQ